MNNNYESGKHISPCLIQSLVQMNYTREKQNFILNTIYEKMLLENTVNMRLSDWTINDMKHY